MLYKYRQLNATVCFHSIYHDMEYLMPQPFASGQGDRVEVCGSVSQEGRFQDVSTLSINHKFSLVHIHVFARCLKVQGH